MSSAHPAPADLPALLGALDAAVRGDGAPPRLMGRVSIGVRGERDAYWFWTAELTEQRARTRTGRALPPSEVALVMDAATADAVLAGEPVAAPTLLAIEGDEQLLERFFERYFKRRSWLDIRAGG